jgi:ribonuclease Z
MVLVWFLGTAGAGGVPGRAKNCILVDTGEERILLDAGPGCAERLKEIGYSVCRLNYIFISHSHVDHWAGLFDIAVRYSVEGCTQPPTVVAGSGAREDVARIVSIMPGRFREEASVRAVHPGGWLGMEHGRLGVLEARHTVPAYGAIVEAANVRIVYSADTSPTRELEEAARNANLLIVEATMPPGMEEEAARTGHHTVSQALEYRRVMRPGSLLVLTHLTRESLSYIAERGIPRGALVASDGLLVSL